MHTLEGLWTVTFQSNFQTLGSGVLVVTGDQLLGGDAHYYYHGTLRTQGAMADATIRVVRFDNVGTSIFGDLDSFSLKVSGDISVTPAEFHGHMVEQPSIRIAIKIQKVALPPLGPPQ